jgi:hypothetical protein
MINEAYLTANHYYGTQFFTSNNEKPNPTQTITNILCIYITTRGTVAKMGWPEHPIIFNFFLGCFF